MCTKDFDIALTFYKVSHSFHIQQKNSLHQKKLNISLSSIFTDPNVQILPQDIEWEEESSSSSSLSALPNPLYLNLPNEDIVDLVTAIRPPTNMDNDFIRKVRNTFHIILRHSIYQNSADLYNYIRALSEMYPEIITSHSHFFGTPIYALTQLETPYIDYIPRDILFNFITSESLSFRCNRPLPLPRYPHSPLENALYNRRSFMSKLLLQHATPSQFYSILIITRIIHNHLPLQHLACLAIKSSLRNTSNHAYESLELPHLVNFMKYLDLDNFFALPRTEIYPPQLFPLQSPPKPFPCPPIPLGYSSLSSS